ncbi:rhodanese-like domain-containing protein [Corallococcus sp. AS-1-6]|uniref:rhodanese-like domain-containing protein n=1 Tax=Corallococcus TaxID=83461 RepID=UPI00359FC2BE|nr:rhodanese-like domain-containing protein [Corallococcus sp. AS-1-6]
MKSVLVVVVAVLAAAPFLVSCAHSRSAGAEAHQRVEAGATLVDVRTPEEFAAGHLPGAVNIPVEELSQRFAELGSPRKPLVVYCRSGARSRRAELFLKERGFQDVFNLGPMSAWE